jgi:large subunit ribosomal protein L3
MGGRMGNRKVTLKNKKIIKIEPEKNILMIKGPVPGPNSGLVLIRK